MYLYDKKKNKFDVYQVKENECNVIAYRKQEIEKIPDEQRILIHQDCDWEVFPLFELYCDNFDSTIIPIEEIEREHRHLLQSNIRKLGRDSLLRSFFKGDFNYASIARVSDLNRLRYLLLTEDKYYDYRDTNGNIIMEMANIIELPRTLFILQMFQQGKYDFLDDEDISKLLDLFQVSKIKELDFDDLKNMNNNRDIQSDYDMASQKSDNDAKVMRMVKKR